MLLSLVASEGLADDDFRWTAPADGLLPALSPGRAAQTSTPTGKAAAVRPNASLRRSRLLLNQIRNGYVSAATGATSLTEPATQETQSAEPILQPVASPGPVPPVPTAEQLAASQLTPVPPAGIRMVSATDSETAVVTIPSVLPPDNIPDVGVSEIETVAGQRRHKGTRPNKKQKVHTADGHVIVRNFRKGTTKIREAGCWLIEFCDPEVFDEDEYHMPILLVSDSDEQPVERPAGSGLLARSLTDIQPTLNYAWGTWEDDELPDDFHERMDNGVYVERYCPQTVLQWAPTNLWYHPLYFQDIGLERYGHTHKPWVQPFVSSGKFFGQFVGLPYQMVLHPPKSRDFALGYYQPGEWAPKKKLAIPFNEEAAATEFLWVTGLLLLIP